MKKFLLLLCVISFPSLGQVQKSLAGFQGVPWGSPMQTVKSKLPSFKETDLCKLRTSNHEDFIKEKREMNEEGYSCIQLIDTKYLVEGTKFFANISFDTNQKLMSVTLANSFFADVNPNYIADCKLIYQNTLTLLSINYGLGITPSNEVGFDKDHSKRESMMWLPVPTQIALSNSSGYKEALRIGKSDLCTVKIEYIKRGTSKL